jgi:diguanylate cyclase (GGDEF)-like protein
MNWTPDFANSGLLPPAPNGPSTRSPPLAPPSVPASLPPAAPAQPSGAELLAQARGALEQADHERAVALALQAAARTRETAEPLATLAGALTLLVAVHRRRGQAEAALAAGQEALPLVQQAGDLVALCELLCNLTLCYLDLGLPQEALRHVIDAEAAARASGDRRMLCWAGNRAGLTCSHLGEYAEAERRLREALALADELDGDEERFSGYTNLGFVASQWHDEQLRRGDTAGARQAAERGRLYCAAALDVVQRHDNTFRQALARANLARFCGLCGDADTALALLVEALRVAQQHGHRQMVLTCESTLGELLVREGQPAAALAPLERALAGLAQHYELGLELDIRLQLANACKALGEWQRALEHHERYHALKVQQLQERADVGSRVLVNRQQLDHARFEAERARMEAELQRTQTAELQQQALHLGRLANEDALTGLGNRRHADQELPRMVQLAQQRGEPLSVALLDLDHFKRINDHHGHPLGDEVLRLVGGLIRRGTRASDLTARVGGEEFMVAFPGLDLATALDACERLRTTIGRTNWEALAPGLKVTVSVGLACGPEATPDALVQRADRALYRAKQEGRDRLVVLR